MASAAVLRHGRTGAYRPHAQKCRPLRANRPRVPFRRPARHRQDHHGPHFREGAELRESAGRRTVLPVRILPFHRRRDERGCDRDRRRHPHPGRKGPRAVRGRPAPSHPLQVQDLHHRRSPHALQERLERPPQDHRGAARPRQVHLRHHRGQQGPPHGHFPLPEVRPPPHPGRRDRRAAPHDRRRRKREDLRCRDQRHCPGGGRRHARCPVSARPAHFLLRRRRVRHHRIAGARPLRHHVPR